MNVRDDLKGLSVDQIKDVLMPNRLNFSILMENDVKDISRGCLVRTANAFSGQRIITYGERRRYDRRSTIGTHAYENIIHVRDVEELRSILSPNTKLIAVEQESFSIPIQEYEFDYEAETVFMMGHESQDGLCKELREIADDSIHIVQRGSVRSLNVIVACGVVLFEYCRKNPNGSF